jgi:SAM-dependent methyltransferase
MTAGREEYARNRIAHWDSVAELSEAEAPWGRFYHQRLTRIYQNIILPDRRVVEIGCGNGDLLGALETSFGMGVDFSANMIAAARNRHPDLRFETADAHDWHIDETFDFIILSDLVNDLWDVQEVFHKLAPMCGNHTRVIINTYSRLWELPLALTRRFELARPTLNQNWLTVDDVGGLLALENFRIIRHWSEILCPVGIPVLEPICNRFLVKMWPLTHLALTNFIVAAPVRADGVVPEEPLVSVIVPARNEAGNVREIFDRVPEMGRGSELVFVEGHSKDDTYQAIETSMAENPQRTCKLFRQNGEGKGDAVRLGFAEAEGDILMILDADLTVPPEDLPRFYDALVTGKGEFINGVRLVYPMEERAMRFFNLMGNKFFGIAFSWLLGQPIKDTLCGTKVLWRDRYESIAANRSYFGDFDPFGDFDLIFGAARLNMKILDLPIRYRERRYGDTNIQRWKHGLLLFKMAFIAALRIKFV